MPVFNKKQTVAYVGISLSQIDRLEKVKQFPPRIILSWKVCHVSGEWIPSRVGWLQDKLDEWVQSRC